MPPGVRFAELAYLVDFMYHGEVSILQDEIQSFMNLAELLKVKVCNQMHFVLTWMSQCLPDDKTLNFNSDNQPCTDMSKKSKVGLREPAL